MGDRTVYTSAESATERQESHWGALQWLASAEIGNADGLTLGRVTIRAGASNPRHCHESCEEILYLLRGRLVHTLGDGSFTLEAGDTISIPAGVYHNAASVGAEDAEMIVAYSSATRDFVLE